MKNQMWTTRVIFAIFRAIPSGLRKMLFKGLALLFYHVSEKNRLIVFHNLSRAFPEKNIAELEKIAKGCYRSLGIVAAEFFDILTITKDNMSGWVDIEGLENYEAAHSKNRGILFFTGHFGNWEIMATSFALLCGPANVVYREMDNPVIRDIVDRIRSYTGNRLVPKERAAKKIIRLLNKNEMVGILIDQNVAWEEGVFVDFFGRPAATTDGLVAIALHTGSPVLPCFNYRMKDGRYRFVIRPEIEISSTGDYDKDLLDNTQRVTTVVEEMIREHPEQWFWLHQRWKTKKTQVVEKFATQELRS